MVSTMTYISEVQRLLSSAAVISYVPHSIISNELNIHAGSLRSQIIYAKLLSKGTCNGKQGWGGGGGFRGRVEGGGLP